jgi:hypothetical protein
MTPINCAVVPTIPFAGFHLVTHYLCQCRTVSLLSSLCVVSRRRQNTFTLSAVEVGIRHFALLKHNTRSLTNIKAPSHIIILGSAASQPSHAHRMQTGHNTFNNQPQQQQQQQQDFSRQADSLDDFGTSVRDCIKSRYQIVGYSSSGPFGEGYHGFAQGSQGHREVFVRAQRHDATDEGWNARRDELMQIHQGLISAEHPAVLGPRDILEIQECNTTAFVFDAPENNVVTLRQFLRGLQQDPDEKVIGALFTPIVAGLQFLEQKSLLPHFARVDIDSCYVYPDGTIRILHPAVAVHGEKGHHHAHKKLEKRLKKVEKKVKKGDAEAGEEREDLFERFIIADLSILLYEVMTRKLSHSSRHKMVHDAKKMHKKEQFSPELSQLLLDMLQAGRTPKKELISIGQIMQRPVMQRFIGMLVANAQHTQQMSEFQKAVYLRMFQRQQLHGGSIAARGKWLASENRESLKRRRQMVRGEGQQLSVLRDQAVEKRNGVRFDIPLEGEARFIPEGRRLSQPIGQQQQQQFQQPIGEFDRPIGQFQQPKIEQQQHTDVEPVAQRELFQQPAQEPPGFGFDQQFGQQKGTDVQPVAQRELFQQPAQEQPGFGFGGENRDLFSAQKDTDVQPVAERALFQQPAQEPPGFGFDQQFGQQEKPREESISDIMKRNKEAIGQSEFYESPHQAVRDTQGGQSLRDILEQPRAAVGQRHMWQEDAEEQKTSGQQEPWLREMMKPASEQPKQEFQQPLWQQEQFRPQPTTGNTVEPLAQLHPQHQPGLLAQPTVGLEGGKQGGFNREEEAKRRQDIVG